MPAPSISVTIGDRGEAQPVPGDVGALFAAGIATLGVIGAVVECRSLSQVKTAFGDVDSGSYLIRTLERFFREGGSRALVSRIGGPAAAKGTLNLSSTAPAVVVALAAISEGNWSNNLQVVVTTTSGSIRNVTFTNNGVTVFSAVFSTAADLVAAFNATGLVTATLGVGTWPIANSSASLTGGSDDRASIPTTVAGWLTVLAAFDEDTYGTGSVALPGITTPAAHEALLRHGQSFYRFALLDGIDTSVAASNETPSATLTAALGSIGGYGEVFVPWLLVDGPGSLPVTIPPCGAVAGRMALADRENLAGPGQPAAARFGEFATVQDVTQTYSQTDRDALADAGVVVIRNIRGKVQPYDDCTLADPDTWPQYATVGPMRVALAIRSQVLAAMDAYIMETIDGNGHLLSAVEKDAVGIGQSWYGREALYGATAGEAFAVQVSLDPANVRRIVADMQIRGSETAKTIDYTITKVAAGDTI